MNAATYYDFPSAQQQQHHQLLLSQAMAKQHDFQQQQQAQQQMQQQNPSVHITGRQPQQQMVYGSPQRRFLSEGELVRQGAELSYARTNNTVDNIRELASSPQHGAYMWKDSSPGYNGNQPPPFPNNQANMQTFVNRGGQPQHHQQMAIVQQQSQPQQPQQFDYDTSRHRSNPTSPTQQYGNRSNAYVAGTNVNQRFNAVPITTSGTYHPALRGGVPVFPPQQSPQIKRKATPTRPISFVRALEMADSMEMQAMSNNSEHTKAQQIAKNNGIMPSGSNSNVSGAGNNGANGNQLNNTQKSTTPTPDRNSVYDINYEISV